MQNNALEIPLYHNQQIRLELTREDALHNIVTDEILVLLQTRNLLLRVAHAEKRFIALGELHASLMRFLREIEQTIIEADTRMTLQHLADIDFLAQEILSRTIRLVARTTNLVPNAYWEDADEIAKSLLLTEERMEIILKRTGYPRQLRRECDPPTNDYQYSLGLIMENYGRYQFIEKSRGFEPKFNTVIVPKFFRKIARNTDADRTTYMWANVPRKSIWHFETACRDVHDRETSRWKEIIADLKRTRKTTSEHARWKMPTE